MRHKPSVATVVSCVAFFTLGGADLAGGTTTHGQSARQTRGRRVQVITIQNEAGLPPAFIVKLRRVLRLQVEQLDAAWPDAPDIRFGRRGWTLTLERTNWTVAYHDFDRKPVAVVSWEPWPLAQPDRSWWTVTTSHELLEMLMNPTLAGRDRGLKREICDPVTWDSYQIDGLWVSNFVLPAWFSHATHSPYDEMHRLRRAGDGHANIT